MTLEDGTRIHVVSLTYYTAARLQLVGAAATEGAAATAATATTTTTSSASEWAPRSLCVLSRWPLLEHMRVALLLLRAAMLTSRAALASAISSFFALPLPLPGIELRLPLLGSWFCLQAAAEGAPRRLGVSISGCIRRLGVDVTLSTLEAPAAALEPSRGACTLRLYAAEHVLADGLM